MLFIIRCQFALGEFERCLCGLQSPFIWGKTLSLLFYGVMLNLLCLFSKVFVFSVVHVFSSGHDMYARLGYYQSIFRSAKCNMCVIMWVVQCLYRKGVSVIGSDFLSCPYDK